METEADTVARNGSLQITPIALAQLEEGSRFEIWLGNVTARGWEGDHNQGWLPQASGSDVLFRRSSPVSFAEALDQAVLPAPVEAGSLQNCDAKFSSSQAGARTSISFNFTASLRNPILENMLLR